MAIGHLWVGEANAACSSATVDLANAQTESGYGYLAKFTFATNSTARADGTPDDDTFNVKTFIEPLGDINRDGFPDFAIGNPSYPANGVADAGAIFVIYGKAFTPGSTYVVDTELGSTTLPGVMLTGSAFGDHLGRVFASDLNEDGTPDLIVSSTGYQDPAVARPGAQGSVTLIQSKGGKALNLGSSASLAPATLRNSQTITNTIPGYFGEALGTGEFVSVGGGKDLVIGVPKSGASRGTVRGGTMGYIYICPGFLDSTGVYVPSALGSCDRLWNGDTFMGENLAVGDFNGDLCSDLVFGDRGFSASTGGSGVLYLLNQPRSGTGSAGTCEGMNAYSTVTSGVADHVIDLSTFSSGGAISGQRVARLRGTLYESETYNERAGAYVIAPGDLDGDGIDDVVTTAYDHTRSSSYNFEGKTHVIYGSSGNPRARVLPLSENVAASRGSSFTGGGTEYKFGKHPGIAGDFDGDGAPDFMSGSNRNRTYLIFGSTSGKSFRSGDIDSEPSVLTILDSSVSKSSDGTSQGVKIGDLDGDGDDEILILVQSRGGPDNHNAYIVSGGCH